MGIKVGGFSSQGPCQLDLEHSKGRVQKPNFAPGHSTLQELEGKPRTSNLDKELAIKEY